MRLLALALLAFSLALTARAGETVAVNDEVVREVKLPRLLSEFGFFADGPAQVPAARVTPYRLNMPLYSDGADKLRFLYLPAGTMALSHGEDLLRFPVGAALIKTFAFGEGRDRRLIETRVLLHRAEGWVALPYIWNEEQTDATLAIAGGRREIATAAQETINYRVPNKNQCKECHGFEGKVVPIGPKARNLSAEWLDDMIQAGLLDRMDDGADIVPQWEARDRLPAEQVARGYLDVNCAHCHRPGSMASNSGLDLRWEQRDPVKIGIGKRPVAAGRGSGGLEFSIVPGDPDESIIVHRMESLDPGVAMPELGKSTVDQEGVSVVRRWIANLAGN